MLKAIHIKVFRRSSVKTRLHATVRYQFVWRSLSIVIISNPLLSFLCKGTEIKKVVSQVEDIATTCNTNKKDGLSTNSIAASNAWGGMSKIINGEIRVVYQAWVWEKYFFSQKRIDGYIISCTSQISIKRPKLTIANIGKDTNDHQNESVRKTNTFL